MGVVDKRHVSYLAQGGSGIEKKDLGSIFFFSSTLGGLTNYVIRHMSKYGNIMSSSASFPTHEQ